jgi:hypothetical protein
MSKGATIKSSENYHFETQEVVPKLQKLRVLLSKYLFTGGHEETFLKNCFTFDQIVAQIQASEEQVKNSLKDIEAVSHSGYWMLIDPIYLDTCFDLILSEITANDWNINRINANECIQALSVANFSSWVIIHTLTLYSSNISNDNTIFTLDDVKIAKFKATQILRKAKVSFIYKRMCLFI